ncbi:hypothetical protein Taro_055176 [Colocasia esculenta]|uniref:Retrotransposon gag domain-containing protein n=1 Tax=Colocasia esculenta TaxID=4460 RepID=A0A843XQC4_COLES|nr:hypothetical protein [Colocasia esculenta]
MTTVTANVITTQGSGGSNEFPPPPLEVTGGTVQETPVIPHLDPAVLELLQRYQAEIEALKRQIRGKEAEGHITREVEGSEETPQGTSGNQPAHFYPQQMDPAVISKLIVEQMIEMKLAELGDGEHVAFDVYMVPYPAHHAVKRLPLGITKPPKFDKFNGRGSPKEHIAYYINVMGDLASDESYLLKFFGSSLTGLAFEWYSSLSTGSISDWADMQKKFRERFYIAEREVTVAELYATRQRNDESALDYIQRWRNLSMRCKRPPHQEDAVEIEAFLIKYSTSSATAPKSKLAKKKPAGKEVHVIDLKTFEQQKGRGEIEKPDAESSLRLLKIWPILKTKEAFLWILKISGLSTIMRDYIALQSISSLPFKHMILPETVKLRGSNLQEEAWSVPTPVMDLLENTHNESKLEARRVGLSRKPFVLIQQKDRNQHWGKGGRSFQTVQFSQRRRKAAGREGESGRVLLGTVGVQYWLERESELGGSVPISLTVDLSKVCGSPQPHKLCAC